MLHGRARGFQHDAVKDVGLAHRERRHAGQVQHHLQDHKARHDHGGAAGIEACRAAAAAHAAAADLAALCRRAPGPMGGCYTEKPLLVC